jgi:ERCC4-related helicase
MIKSRKYNSENFLKLRKYQEEILEFAKNQNAVCLLSTGSGKTMIAIHLIKHCLSKCNLVDDIHPEKKVVFLAPTVVIVQQQYFVCKEALPYKVG